MAPTPLLAGFPPAAAALAVAAAFGLQATPLRAQPVGPQVIAGQASFASSGANLVVTTQNAVGSNHSAINWQSFSVPAGSTTQFVQPSSTSTSINRVVGSDPSAIYGTLSSNGKLVLVNPAGITVGQGAVVDTAGFTASTLGMGEADAIVGRLRFSAGTSAGPLVVNGSIVARGGDIVLIAPQVQTGAGAVIQSDGATVLAAGQKVEITGRGLEGIQLQVQAPQDSVVNLGTLKGDAVAMFAGTLKHSGLVQAQAVSTEGGKVVLRALGDALVSGAIIAQGADGKGGSVDVLGDRVALLAGASIDASGATGGGQVRVGGDYQGKNADVPNASQTYVDAAATIRADATQQGDGGRVIVWSDEATQMYGQISARGGAQGGNGGFAEVSSKQYLAYAGLTDLRAPQGSAGTLLLDPEDVDIVHGASGSSTPTPGDPGAVFDTSGGANPTTITDGDLNAQLALSHVQVTTGNSSGAGSGGLIHLVSGADVNWTSGNSLMLYADKGIRLDGTINGSSAGVANGGLTLLTKAGDISQGTGSVIKVDNLYASAGTQWDSTQSGRVLLTDGTNTVNRLAGASYGTDAQFRFTNSGTFAIASVGNAFSSASGIAAYDDSGSLGTIAVTAASGDLYVSSGNTLNSGSVTLSAPGGSINVTDADMYARSGALSLSAANGVSVSGGMMSGNSVSIAATGADSNVDFGDSSATVAATTGGIDIRAGGGILMSNASLQTNGGMTGSVTLTASNGDVNVANIRTDGTYVSGVGGTKGGDVTVNTTGGDIVLGGVSANGGYGYGTSATAGGGGGGSITLTAQVSGTGGNVSVGSISAYGGSASMNGGNGGSVTINADNDITLSGAVQLYGGEGAGISGSEGSPDQVGAAGRGGQLNATARNGSITVGYVSVQGGYGYSLASGGGGGSVILKAGSAVTALDTLEADGGYGDHASGGAGGSIQLTGGDDVSVTYLRASGGGSSTDVSGSVPAGGAGGTITVTSTNGNIAFGSSNPSLSPYGGASAMGGYGSGYANGGHGGSITVTANGSTGGQITGMGELQVDGGGAYNGVAGSGGTVTINARSDIQLADVSASAGSAGSAGGGTGGSISITTPSGSFSANQLSASGDAGGGSISVVSGGNITISNATAIGKTNSSMSSAGGGAGGSITLQAQNTAAEYGNITVYNSVDVSGADGSTNGGNAGSITVQGDKAVHLSWLSAYGGYATLGSGNGGAGGRVLLSSATAGVTVDGQIYMAGGNGLVGGKGGSLTIQAAGDINVGNADSGFFGVVADGGAGAAGAGGQGGDVTLTSSGGSINVHDSDGSYGITAAGGSGAPGGMGGSVTLQAAGDVNVPAIQAFGGDGSADGGGASAGKGGTVSVSLGGNLSSGSGTTMDAGGGNGQGGGETVANGGAGGDGGSITVQKSTGDFALSGLTAIASGGLGGDATSESSGTGGAGGTGGTITVESVLGSMSLAGSSLSSSGSFAGINGDGTQGALGGLGMTNVHAAGDLDISDTDMTMFRSGFTALAGGSITVNSAITTSGGAVTLSAGDPAFGSAAKSTASLDVNASIDTTDGFSVAGAPVSLAATGAVTVDAGTLRQDGFTALVTTDQSSPTGVTGSSVSVKGAQVTVAADSGLIGTTDGVQVTTDSLLLAGYIDAGGGVATIQALTPTTTVHLGSTDSAGALGLDQSELANIYAGRLVLGDSANTGGLFVDSDVSVDPQLYLLTGGKLTLNGVVTGNYGNVMTTALVTTDPPAATTSSTAIVLSANSYDVGAGGGLSVGTSSRWLAYVGGPLEGNNFGTLQSNNLALWGRTFAGNPPDSVAETGNRYLFAVTPTITIDAPSVSREYDGTKDFNIAVTTSGLVDASQYGNVFTQDAAPTASVGVPDATKNVGSYGIQLLESSVPAGYASTFNGGTATITPRMLNVSAVAANKEYDATTAAQVTVSGDRVVAGDALGFSAAAANFSDKNAGTGKTVSFGTITLTGADAGNYQVASAPTSARADITPAPLTIQANDLSKVQGSEYVFSGTEFTATGLKGGETINSATLTSDGAPSAAPVGAYPIFASNGIGGNGFSASNYAVTYQNGTMVVASPGAAQQVLNQVVTFATLFIQEANTQSEQDQARLKKDLGKDNIVSTDQCRP